MMWLLVGLAIADIPPPPGYVEQCTIEKMQEAGASCTECSASFQGREDCEALEKDGYVQKCKTSGASVWKEVLCKDAENAAPPGGPEAKAPEPKGEELVEPPKKASVEREEKGCATAPSGALGLSVLTLGFFRRRRSV